MIDNIYATIGIIAALMFLDYYLTLKGLKMYKGKYSKHFKFESYELNPMFREKVQAHKYSMKHLVSVILTSALVYFVYYFGLQNRFGLRPSTFYLVQGLVFSMLIYTVLRHIQNILIFRAIDKDPSMLSGIVRQKLAFELKAGMTHAFTAFLLLFIVYLFVPTSFTLGFALGPLAMTYRHWTWLRKHKK